ncbi:MAG: hypothetical protein LBR83_02800, partial [Clostridiales bacterium]|nr:hypothetical protein [Clostridiales bacterium]
MKKKLALLLAAVMALTMLLPVGVTGASTVRPYDQFLGDGDWAETEVWIDLSEYWGISEAQNSPVYGTTTAIALRVELSGAEWSSLYTTDQDSEAATADDHWDWDGDLGYADNWLATARPASGLTGHPVIAAGSSELDSYESLVTSGLEPGAHVSTRFEDHFIKTPVYAASTRRDSAIPNANLYYQFDPVSSSQGYVYIYDFENSAAVWESDSMSGAYIALPVYYRLTDSAATLRISDYNYARVTTTWPLARRTDGTVTLSAGDPVKLYASSSAELNAIRVSEAARGMLTPNGETTLWTLRLEAPAGFDWEYDANNVKAKTLYESRYIVTSGLQVSDEYVNNGGNHVLWIDFTAAAGYGSDPVYGWPETLSFTGVSLAANGSAVAGAVNVEAKIQTNPGKSAILYLQPETYGVPVPKWTEAYGHLIPDTSFSSLVGMMANPDPYGAVIVPVWVPVWGIGKPAYGNPKKPWEDIEPTILHVADYAEQTIAEKIEDLLNQAENSQIDPQVIKNEVLAIDASGLENALDVSEVKDDFKALEEIYQDMTDITVEITADMNTHADFKNSVDEIEVVGAAFNAAPGQKVEIHFSKPKPQDVKELGPGYKTRDIVQVDISITGVNDPANLDVPVIITVPIPNSMEPNNFRILHYHDDGTLDVIRPIINSDETCTFTVYGFSVFVFANLAETVTPSKPGGSTGSIGSGSSGSKSSSPQPKPPQVSSVSSGSASAQTLSNIKNAASGETISVEADSTNLSLSVLKALKGKDATLELNF